MAHVAALPPLPAFQCWRCHAGWKWKRAGERAEPGAAGQRCKRRGWWLVAWRAGWHRRLRQAAGQSSCGWWLALQRLRCGWWAVGGACARGGGGAPRNFIVTRRLCAHAGAMWHPEDHRCAGDLMFYLVAVIARGGARRGAAGGGQRQAVAPGSTRESKLPEACRRFWIWPSCFFAVPRLSFS